MRNQLRWDIIKLFSCKNLYAFEIRDVLNEFPEENPGSLAKILTEMVKQGMLSKITRNIYHIIPLNELPESYVPGRFQVVKYMMHRKAYYIAYASAMFIHGLGPLSGDQKSQHKEFIVTDKQTKPAIRIFGGITYQFIQQGYRHYFGFKNFWINQYEQARVSDLEKTIVDISTKPQFSGGVVGLANAIYHAYSRIDNDKLFYYFSKNQSKSARKRFLFLTDLLEMEWTIEHDKMMAELGTGISILNPAAPDQGKTRSKFGLKINVAPHLIREKILSRV